ncbi:MAG: carbon monoxide dehydrogenase, partial [Actinomycetota bacterium]
GDGIGHPFWFGRQTFAALADIHGDKAVWKVIESGRFDVHEVPVEGPIPPDVDTWDDYRSLVSTVP